MNEINKKDIIVELTEKIALNQAKDVYYLERGNFYLNNGCNDEAIKDFTTALELNPRNADLWMARSCAYKAAQNYSESINDLTNAIKINPRCHYYYKLRGLSYMDFSENKLEHKFSHYDKFGEKIYTYSEKPDGVIHSLSKAIHDFNRAINLYPESTQEIKLLLAYAYKTCGLYYQKTILDTIDWENLDNLGNFKRNLLRAINNFTKAIDIDANDVSLYYARAHCYYELNNYQKAINDYTKVIELDHEFAKNSLIYFERSHCFYNIGEYNKALKDVSYSKKFFYKELELSISKQSKEKSIIDSRHTKYFINIFRQPTCPNVFFIKVLEIIFELNKYNFYNESYLKNASLQDINFKKNNDELFIIRCRLSLLEDISKAFIEETLCLPQEKRSAKRFNQQANFMLIFFEIYRELTLHYRSALQRKEKEKTQAKIEERNKVIADLSHSIKNLISTVIDPLENMKKKAVVKQPIIDSAIRGANLVREIVNAMNLSYKGSIEDFRYDAKNNNGNDKQDIRMMILESLKSSVRNMYDGKYFSAFQEGYFQTEQYLIEAKSDWNTTISQSKNLEEFSEFLSTYFFEPFIDIKQTENFVMGNERGSAVKLLILFGELILNAVKYSAFVKRDKRFFKIEILHNSKEIFILIENRFNPKKRVKTTGLGNVVITNFAKLLNTYPIINRENDIYSVQINFENFWDRSYS